MGGYLGGWEKLLSIGVVDRVVANKQALPERAVIHEGEEE